MSARLNRSKNAVALAVALAASLLAVHSTNAAADTWNATGGPGDGLTWDTSTLNWDAGTAAFATGDSVLFTDANGGNYTINLPASISAAGITDSATTGNYTINIAAGQTLTDTSDVVIGQTAVGLPTTLTLVGTSGSYDQTGGNLTISPVNALGTAPVGDLNASGLNAFTYNNTSGNVLIANGCRTLGKLELPNAGANPAGNIIASRIDVGNSVPLTGSTGNNGGTSVLTLGSFISVLEANTFNIGGGKASGKITVGTPGATVFIAGSTGGTSTATITIGKQSSATGGGNPSALFLAGDNATVQAGTIIMGELAGATGGIAQGNVTFDTGTFSANSFQLAVDSSGVDSAGAQGLFTLGTSAASTGTLTVSTTFDLGNLTSTAAAHTDTASFTINGGTANIQADINAVNGTANLILSSTLSLLGGTLNMNGHQIGHATGNNKNITTVNMPITSKTATLQNLGGTGINDNGLSVNGGGTLVLAGTDTYSNNTAVSNNSTLLVDGAYTGTGSFSVASGSTLGGKGNAGALVSIAAGANLSPGDNNIGALAVGSATLIGTLNIDLNDADPNINDLLTDAGTLDLTALTSAVNFNITGTPSAPAYIFATYNSLAGTFATNNLPAGYNIDYDYQGNNDIALVAGGGTPTPEPTSLALLALASPLLFKRRRK